MMDTPRLEGTFGMKEIGTHFANLLIDAGAINEPPPQSYF